MYAAIDVGTKLVLDAELFDRRGTDSATPFLHRLTEHYDVAETGFLVDGFGYLTVLSRLDQNSHLNQRERNLIKKVSDATDTNRPLSYELDEKSDQFQMLDQAIPP